MILTMIGTAAVAALAGGVTHAYHKNKEDKIRVAYQNRIRSLQKKIEELIKKIKEKDEEILRLMNKVGDLEIQLRDEAAKRDQIHQMITVLLERQKKLKSVMHALLMIVSFRIRNWKTEKIEIRQQLANANLQAVEVDNLLSTLAQEKERCLAQRNRLQNDRENLATEQQVLEKKIDEESSRLGNGVVSNDM